MDLLHDCKRFFFIGVGGAGMSAIAQYLSGNGYEVKGSDRLFSDSANAGIQHQLEAARIQCFQQDGTGLDNEVDVVIVSTAIEDTNMEVKKAREHNIPIVLRADLLAAICQSKRTIAIAGTSGKSTVTAMLFHILYTHGLSPSLITGAGLVSLQKEGLIGNAYCGKSDWLLIEADESDGTLVKYKPEIGILLSIDKDHKELHELEEIFAIFKGNTQKQFIVNQSHALASRFSADKKLDFGEGTRWAATDFYQDKFTIHFQVQDVTVEIPTIGYHNVENALACMAAADVLGLSVQDCARALVSYAGIYRRHQRLGCAKGITVIDDYAHNPAKIAASILACQPVAPKLVAWFQPHGFGPTRFIRKELVEEISRVLRPNDEIWMSEIYYAGGTAVKDISSADLIHDLQAKGVKAFFVADRMDLFRELIPTLQQETVLLMMGARDPGLETLAAHVWQMLSEQ